MKYVVYRQQTDLSGGQSPLQELLVTHDPVEAALRLSDEKFKLVDDGYEVRVTDAGTSGRKGREFVTVYCQPPLQCGTSDHDLLEEDFPTSALTGGTGAPPSSGEAADEAPIVPVRDGTYTITYGDGSWRTFRLRTQSPDANFAPGSTVIAYLSGPNNDCSGGDWTQFAFYDRAKGTYHVWKRHDTQTVAMQKIRQGLGVLFGDPDAAAEAYALRSGRCSRCNRKLTVPASIHRGLGPDCAGMV